ncbi:MAG: diguanylate cyclase [Planctomycetes bacterium]|nr:diguanylate cyclase [Planctomycetota bacterium]
MAVDRRVLAVDDDPAMLKLLSRHLSNARYEVLTAASGAEALNRLHREGAGIVLSDWSMPQMDGLELCKAIRASEALGFVYLIMVTAHSDKGRVVEALEAGANDFLTKPFDAQELLARVNAGMRIISLETDLQRQQRELHKINAELAILNRKLESMARTDELTGLANRRAAMSQLKACWANSVRHGQPLSCLMMDIDLFKRCNDTYGHDVGDEALRQTARVLTRCARGGDLVHRTGGEEFLVLCANTTGSMAVQAAERFRAEVEANTIQVGTLELKITISVGAAERTGDTLDAEDLLKRADRALYRAKRSGRNRVVLLDPEPAELVAAGDADAHGR